jgi:hypothetical protein
MDCEKAKVLLAPHILGDLDDDPQQCRELQAHLLYCTDCAEMYKGFQEVIGFVRNHKTEFAQAFKNVRAREREKGIVLARPVSSKPVESTEEPRRFQLFLRISAVAACLVIGVFTWRMFSTRSTSKSTPEIASRQAVPEPKPSVKIELISEDGSSFLADSQHITSASKLRTIVINGKHRMVMNTQSSLSIEPLMVNAQLGCIVKLTNGQIYTHVQHDGNPFIVDTANGQAVITGTTFDIKTTKDSTTLVVSEGTVRFESEKGTVNVAAGQKSEIVGQSDPSIPLACNTYELTAWATGYKPNTALVQDKSNDIDLYLELPLRTDPIVLANTDYDFWVNEKRNWFKTNFPWIFELKDALAREGIEVDYPELLIKGGDVWQFVFLQRFPGRFSVPDFESLLKTAASYGFGKEWLLENVPIAKLIQDKSLISENLTGLDAFDQLLKYVKGTKAMPYYLYLADAGRYLTETRSLIWFAANDGEFNLTDEQRAEVLDLLQQEVIAVTNCFNDLLYPEDEKKKPLCGEVCETPETKIVGYIETIKVIEENFTEYLVIK